MRGRYVALSILALGAGLAGGVALERFHFAAPAGEGDSGPNILYWVAPMDANFRKDSPGKSPMGMDLVPVYEGGEPSGDPSEVQLSAREVNAIGVRTAVARTERVAPVIETVGFVTYDEDATSHVHARIEGWVENLRVRAVGDPVRAGQPLFEVYGPRQERETMDRVGAAAEYLRVTAPQSGVVTALNASEGMYLEPGIRALSVTDLATVWVIADVFEKDIGRLSEGMRAEARFEPLPRDVFEGEIDYIYPELDPKTRTLSVRLRFDNSAGTLRPNMYGTVRLVASEARETVTVPSEALIRTGRAERVILKTGDGTFRPRLVTTGLRDGFGAGGRTELVQGLTAGEEVVASAQFLIDSESALSAGMTRMAPTDAEPVVGKGRLLGHDPETSMVEIAHAAIPGLDWPAMQTTFALRDGVRVDRVKVGQDVRFTLSRGADGLLSLTKIGRDDGVDATGTGMVHAITPSGKLNLSHDPIPSLSWPAMTMDLDVAGVDLDAVPLGAPVEFDLSEAEGGLYTVIAVRPKDGGMLGGMSMPDPSNNAAKADPPMQVSGTIDAVDLKAGTATVTHGPIAEIGMPGMTMDFAVDPEIDLGALSLDTELTLSLTMDPETFQMTVVGVKGESADNPEPPQPEPASDKAEMMEVSGVVNTVDRDDRIANVTHGPMAEIGMPGMTMDFKLADDLDIAALPMDEQATLLISMNPETFEMTLEGVR